MNAVLKRRLFNRRNFLAGALACAGGLGGIGYMRFGEAEWLEINERIVTFGLPAQESQRLVTSSPTREELRILHLSDFHASPVVGLEFIREAVELGISLKPDLVCLTGDFVTRKYGRFAEYSAILKRLSEAGPAFACVGNHDGGSWVKRWGYSDWAPVGNMLSAAGVTVLHNSTRTLEVKGKTLQFVGIGDLWAREIDPVKAFARTEKNLRTIVLSHNPDSKDVLGDHAWDLMLCGHTHGGQLRLPWIGTPFAPVRDKRYVAGLKPWKDRWIHVTKGVGNLHGMRFNCRPEVSLLRVML